jgi:hypothetical protein
LPSAVKSGAIFSDMHMLASPQDGVAEPLALARWPAVVGRLLLFVTLEHCRHQPREPVAPSSLRTDPTAVRQSGEGYPWAASWPDALSCPLSSVCDRLGCAAANVAVCHERTLAEFVYVNAGGPTVMGTLYDVLEPPM